MSVATNAEPRSTGTDVAPLDSSIVRWDDTTAPMRRWPFWAVAAGVTGFVANFLSLGEAIAQDDPDPTIVVRELARGKYHAAFVLGLATAAGLAVVATGLRHWAARRAPGRLAAQVMPNALMITSALAVIAACMAGSLAVYLPGGMDDGTMWTEGLMSNYFYLDFGALVGWWGALFAAACSLSLSFGRARILPRWLGVVTVPLVALPAAAAAISGLPGLPGMTMPIWLVALGIALSRETH